jgi:predicted ribosome quality control (RQC) complex YloA/Tae2 family protein
MHYLQIETLFSDWQAQWVGARLQKVYQHGKQTLTLSFYGNASTGGEICVLLDFSRSQSAMLVLPETVDTVSALPRMPVQGFAQALRKHLVGHRLLSMSQRANDRWVCLTFAQGVSLVLELSGRHSNAFLCSSEAIILAQWRRDRSQRGLQGGMPYVPPETPGVRFQRPDPLHLKDYPRHERQQLFANFVLHQRQHFEQAERIRAYKQQLMQVQQRLGTEIVRLEQALEDIAQQTVYQQRAELLQAAFANPPLTGASRVQVPDYYQPGQPLVEIALNPALGLQQNIARYYQRARKAERGAAYALEHLPALMDQQTQWSQYRQALEAWEQALLQGQLLDTETCALLRSRADLLAPTETKKHRISGVTLGKAARTLNREGIARHARRFQAQELMWVGKSAKDNHQLTFRYAKGSDYWLHVQDSSGSHVLVKSAQLTAQSLEEAAHLAAYYSPQKQAFQRGEPVSVCYTQVKYVKAIKGGAPGRVQMQQFKTYLVRYREACWEALSL